MSHALAQGLLPLVPPELSPLLGRLQLPKGLRRAHHRPGPHLSPARGQSVEFFEHRDYHDGDDPRRIDWRASAKGDRTMVRFGEREQHSPVYVFLDNHLGMAYGPNTPPQRWAWARGVAALLAHNALIQGDPVALVMEPTQLLPASTSRPKLARLSEQLHQDPTASSSQLLACVRAWSKLDISPARLFFISDWLDLSQETQSHDDATHELFSLLRDLGHRGHQSWGLELLHRDELELRFSPQADALNFIDPTHRRPSQIGDPNAMREQYLQALNAHRQALASLAVRAAMQWCPMRSDQPWANALHQHLGAPSKGT